MRKAEIDALVRAHRGRARPVAFFHVLRQSTLEPDDHAFLMENVDELGASDLLRWRARCEKGHTGAVIRTLARRAIADPANFQHEVLDLPRLELDEHEWRELADLVKGKVPASIYSGILAHGGPRPTRPPAEFFFTPRVLAPLTEDDVDIGEILERAAAAGGLEALSTRDVVLAKRAGSPIDEDVLVALAMDRARTSSEDWSLAALDFPVSLIDAVVEKARSTKSHEERANLLGWLESEGVLRATLMAIALAPLEGGQSSFGVVAWLARQLGTRAAWDKYGLETVSALMRERAHAELGELVTIVWSEGCRTANEPPRGLLEAIQVAFALTLIEAIRGDLGGGRNERAMAALSALACLDPPSRVSRAVHDLRRAEGADAPEIAELIAVNERLVKHTDARDASLEGVIAALHAIADASG